MKITGTKKDLEELAKKDTGLTLPKNPTLDELKKQKENEELRKVFKGEKK